MIGYLIIIMLPCTQTSENVYPSFIDMRLISLG